MLSILQREMRVASRKKWTFRIRLATNVIAFLLAAPMVVFTFGNPSGAGIFNVLIFFSFWFCLLQGVRLASSSIADEKRDGTLGLLFLTDLRPIDIVAGKLFAIFLPMIQPLLAFLPVLSISILLGGVMGGEIFRAGIVLGTTLFFSVSTGLFVSSLSRSVEETGKTTMALLLLAVFIPRLASGRFSALQYLSLRTGYLAISDPGYRVAPDNFWFSVLIANALACAFLWAAAYFLPRRWGEFNEIIVSKKKKLFVPRFSETEKAKLLNRNPGEWLAMRHSMHRLERWIFNAAMIGLCLFALGVELFQSGGSGGGFVVLVIGTFIVMIRLASQASYPLCEARRSGAVEMILSTPLNPGLLIRGQMNALWRQFRWSVGVLVVTSFLIPALIILKQTGAGEAVGSVIGASFYTFATVAGPCLVAVVGMWMGLKEKSPNSAFFMTILYVFGPVFVLFCLWIVIPFYWLVLFIVAVDKISGRNYRKLLLNEKAERYTVAPPPVIAVAKPAS